ncbi:MAG: Stf0 family sulfotransferase [Cyanobacteria bacterium P01_E01_bin.42]
MDFLEERKNIKQSYIICSTGRSGSTLLGRSLKKLGCCGNPEEYFHHRVKIEPLKLKENSDNFLNYCNLIFQEGRTDNGVFGIKMHWWQMYEFLKMAKKVPQFKDKQDLEILNIVFPNLQFIYIWRENILAQAVSTSIALQTKVWEKGKNTKNKNSENKEKPILKFKPLNIYDWKQKLKDQNQRWKVFLKENDLEYHELTYEKLVGNFEREMNNVLDFLKIDKSLISEKIEMEMKKQSTNTNQKFIKSYTMFPELLLRVGYKIKTFIK